MKIKFHIENHGEYPAGLMPYYDEVTIDVKYNPGGEDGEFLEYMRESIKEWFDGSDVLTEEEWNDEKIAEMFGISKSGIGHIRRGTRWSHVK